MQAFTIPRVIAAGAVLVSAALVLLTRTAGIDPSSSPAAIAVVEEPSIAATVAETAPPAEGSGAAATLRELGGMSETVRNTTFLIAIRDAGFVCYELLRVYGGVDESAKWIATCSEMLAYTVGVSGDGTLHVEPFQQYFDGVGPRAIEPRFDAPPQQSPQPLR